MPIRNVIFDFGGVLVRWKPREIIDSFYSEVDLRERLAQSVFQHSDWVDLDRGVLSEEQAVERFAARMRRRPEEMRALLGVVKESLIPLDESFKIARELARRGYQLYGLSNISVPMFTHLRERSDRWRIFRGIVISGEIQLAKPDKAIFEYLCRRYDLKPVESIFIDDHLPNIETARALNFRTVLFENVSTCVQELEALTREKLQD
jgi:putative hydrolase of the HAD superfamily